MLTIGSSDWQWPCLYTTVQSPIPGRQPASLAAPRPVSVSNLTQAFKLLVVVELDNDLSAALGGLANVNACAQGGTKLLF